MGCFFYFKVILIGADIQTIYFRYMKKDKEMEEMGKLIYLPKWVIKEIDELAHNQASKFKPFVELQLSNMANDNIALKKIKRKHYNGNPK